jgi:hypothetical protein
MLTLAKSVKIRKIFFEFDYHFVLHYLSVSTSAPDWISTSYLYSSPIA